MSRDADGIRGRALGLGASDAGRPCLLEVACARPDDRDCRAPLRPGPAGCGIDVFTTSGNAGWPLKVVRGPGDPYHRFALVLVE